MWDWEMKTIPIEALGVVVLTGSRRSSSESCWPKVKGKVQGFSLAEVKPIHSHLMYTTGSLTIEHFPKRPLLEPSTR